MTESTVPGPGSAESTVIQLDHVRKEFGSFVAVHDADFAIRKGEFFSMLGPSGCGKTTLLKMIAGLVRPDRGTATVDGRPYVELPNPTRVVGLLLDDRIGRTREVAEYAAYEAAYDVVARDRSHYLAVVRAVAPSHVAEYDARKRLLELVIEVAAVHGVPCDGSPEDVMAAVLRAAKGV